MKKKILIVIFILLILIISVTIYFYLKNKDNKEIEIDEIKKEEQLTEEEKNEIDKIKQETGKQGETEIYEIQDSYNTQIATVKSSVKYKVAFAGMIKKDFPKMDELNLIIEEYHPKYAGIWIDENNREEFLKYLSEIANSEYKIDENGYLRIENKNTPNSVDKKIEKIIKGKELSIISISSVCYIVDEITGEILDQPFEKIDQYQTYEYFEDGDKKIIFITENSKKQMTSKEIIQSVINLL